VTGVQTCALPIYRRWVGLEEPHWAMLNCPKIDFQDQYYYARPKSFENRPKSLDEVDPELLRTYEKLGIPLREQMILAGVEGADAAPADGRRVAVDAVFDSVSVEIGRASCRERGERRGGGA